MLRSLRREVRGQADPIAALVAVAVVCLAVSLYAGYATDAVAGTDDRTVAESSLDQVWAHLHSNGVYDPHERGPETLTDRDLPDGYHVAVEVSVREEGSREIIDERRFDAHGGDEPDEVPADVQTASRSVPIENESRPGDVRVGELRVVVWS